jgi:hypothetical protein
VAHHAVDPRCSLAAIDLGRLLIAAALVVWVLAGFIFSGAVEGRRFLNVYEAGDYWLLAVFLWLSISTVIYVRPRWL